MKKTDKDNFDFIKNMFDEEKPELPQSLSTDAIRAKLGADDEPKVVKLNRKNNFFAIAAAAAVFLIAVGAAVALNFGNSNPEKIENFDPFISEADKISGFASYDELNSTIDSLSKIPPDGEYGAGLFYTKADDGEDGVEKPDTIKTDGKYIYYAYQYPWGSDKDRIYVFSVNGEKTKFVSAIDPLADGAIGEDEDFSVSGLFVSGNSLAVIMEKRNLHEFSYGRDLDTAVTKIYDISNKSAPKFVTEFEQSGKLFITRMVNDTLYVVSNYEVASNDREFTVPYIRQGDERSTVSPDEIYSFETMTQAQYAVISSIDLQNRKQAMPLMAVLGGSPKVHCTKSYMFINEYIKGEIEGEPERAVNAAMKLDLRNGYIAYATEEEIDKYTNDTVDLVKGDMYDSTLYPLNGNWLNIGEYLDRPESDISLYDKDFNELDRKVFENLFVNGGLAVNEEHSVYALHIMPSGFITFEIQNDRIVITNEITDAGNEELIFIGNRIYSISVIDDDAPDEERIEVLSYKY